MSRTKAFEPSGNAAKGKTVYDQCSISVASTLSELYHDDSAGTSSPDNGSVQSLKSMKAAPESLTVCNKFAVGKRGQATEHRDPVNGYTDFCKRSSATELWERFVTYGEISSTFASSDVDDYEAEVACAICLKKTLHSLQKKDFPFAVAW